MRKCRSFWCTMQCPWLPRIYCNSSVEKKFELIYFPAKICFERFSWGTFLHMFRHMPGNSFFKWISLPSDLITINFNNSVDSLCAEIMHHVFWQYNRLFRRTVHRETLVSSWLLDGSIIYFLRLHTTIQSNYMFVQSPYAARYRKLMDISTHVRCAEMGSNELSYQRFEADSIDSLDNHLLYLKHVLIFYLSSMSAVASVFSI